MTTIRTWSASTSARCPAGPSWSRVADGAELGTRRARVRARRRSSDRCRPPASRCRRTGRCRCPRTSVDVLRHAVPAALAAAGVDPAAGHRHRHRLHRVHGAAGARRRHAAVRAAEFADRPHAYAEAVEAPRRPAAGRPDQRARRTSAASRGSPATAARSPRSGSSPRRCSCSRRTRRSTPRTDRWIEAADWIVWQLCGVETRNACTAGYKGDLPGRRATRRADFLAALNPGFAGFAATSSTHPLVAARRPRRPADRARRPRWTGLPEGIAVAVGNVDAHVTAAAAQAVEPGQMVAIMGTSTCHVMNGDRARRGARHVRGGRRRHRRRACGATRPARAASATSSPGSSTTRCPPPTPTRPPSAGSACTSYLTALAAAQPVGAARPGRARLAQRQPLGAGRPRPVRRDRRPDPGHPARGRLPGADRGDRVRHPDHRRDVRGGRACRSSEFVVAGGLLKNALPHADLRRRAAPPARRDRLRAGPGARLGDPRRGRRRAPTRTSPRPPRRWASVAAGRLHARPGRRRRLRPAVRRVPRRCTTTSAGGATSVLHRLRPLIGDTEAPLAIGRGRRDRRRAARGVPRCTRELVRVRPGRLDRRQRLGARARRGPVRHQAERRRATTS